MSDRSSEGRRPPRSPSWAKSITPSEASNDMRFNGGGHSQNSVNMPKRKGKEKADTEPEFDIEMAELDSELAKSEMARAFYTKKLEASMLARKADLDFQELERNHELRMQKETGRESPQPSRSPNPASPKQVQDQPAVEWEPVGYRTALKNLHRRENTPNSMQTLEKQSLASAAVHQDLFSSPKPAGSIINGRDSIARPSIDKPTVNGKYRIPVLDQAYSIASWDEKEVRDSTSKTASADYSDWAPSPLVESYFEGPYCNDCKDLARSLSCSTVVCQSCSNAAQWCQCSQWQPTMDVDEALRHLDVDQSFDSIQHSTLCEILKDAMRYGHPTKTTEQAIFKVQRAMQAVCEKNHSKSRGGDDIASCYDFGDWGERPNKPQSKGQHATAKTVSEASTSRGTRPVPEVERVSGWDDISVREDAHYSDSHCGRSACRVWRGDRAVREKSDGGQNSGDTHVLWIDNSNLNAGWGSNTSNKGGWSSENKSNRRGWSSGAMSNYGREGWSNHQDTTANLAGQQGPTIDPATVALYEHHIRALQHQIHQQAAILDSHQQYQQTHAVDFRGPAHFEEETLPPRPASGTSEVQATGLRKEAAFIRERLASGKLSSEDRQKAINILSIIEGGNSEPSITTTKDKDVKTKSTTFNVSSGGHDSGSGNMALDLKMHDLTKAITKMKAFDKFQRMQQDTDRLARIEEKLSKPEEKISKSKNKIKESGRVSAFQKRTAREVEKLNKRFDELLAKDTGKCTKEDIEDLRAHVDDNGQDFQASLGRIDGMLQEMENDRAAAQWKDVPASKAPKSAAAATHDFCQKCGYEFGVHGKVKYDWCGFDNVGSKQHGWGVKSPLPNNLDFRSVDGRAQANTQPQNCNDSLYADSRCDDNGGWYTANQGWADERKGMGNVGGSRYNGDYPRLGAPRPDSRSSTGQRHSEYCHGVFCACPGCLFGLGKRSRSNTHHAPSDLSSGWTMPNKVVTVASSVNEDGASSHGWGRKSSSPGVVTPGSSWDRCDTSSQNGSEGGRSRVTQAESTFF